MDKQPDPRGITVDGGENFLVNGQITLNILRLWKERFFNAKFTLTLSGPIQSDAAISKRLNIGADPSMKQKYIMVYKKNIFCQRYILSNLNGVCVGVCLF